MTTAANVIFLHYTAPVFTALLGAWLLRERVCGGVVLSAVTARDVYQSRKNRKARQQA